MNREQRRSEANTAIRCADCGASIKPANLDGHYARVHPGVRPGAPRETPDEAVAERERSREEVKSLDAGSPAEGAQTPEQEPIPNPTGRRPSTQDRSVGS